MLNCIVSRNVMQRMDLHWLMSRLSERLKAPLPGSQAHETLRATPLGGIPSFVHKAPPKPGSVIILLHEEAGIIKFPLIKRPQYLGAHSNQVSLPGGKAELDENAIETAVREAEEEIGVPRDSMNVLGTLSTFFVIPSNFMVTPVVAVTSQPSFKPDSREVAKILQGDLQLLVHDAAIQTSEILAANLYRMEAPHFLFEDEIVWGATAMILNEFRMIVREII
jgi:8-oxo-dGTP pyrophosphatase MutT (NUDIX family)